MNITQLTERLTNLAERLPHGLESEVYLMMCEGHDLSESTNYVSVSQITFDFREDDAVLVGHPHMHHSLEPCDSIRRVNVVLVD